MNTTPFLFKLYNGSKSLIIFSSLTSNFSRKKIILMQSLGKIENTSNSIYVGHQILNQFMQQTNRVKTNKKLFERCREKYELSKVNKPGRLPENSRDRRVSHSMN